MVDTRAVDPDIAAARSRLANATKNGDFDSIALARTDLESAKQAAKIRRANELREEAEAAQQEHTRAIAQFRREADTLLADPSDRSHPWLNGTVRTTKVHHNELLVAQTYLADRFCEEHGHPSHSPEKVGPSQLWSAKTKAAYENLMQRGREAHKAISCQPGSPCRGMPDRAS